MKYSNDQLKAYINILTIESRISKNREDYILISQSKCKLQNYKKIKISYFTQTDKRD